MQIRKQSWTRFDQCYRGAARINVPKVSGQCVMRKFGDCARELDTGWATADDDKAQQAASCYVIVSHLRLFKSSEDASTNSCRIVNALKAGGYRFPVLVPEIRVGGARRDNEIVKSHGCILQIDLVPGDIDIRHLIQ